VFPGFLVRYGNPDLGVILTGYVGLFLVVAAQVAFGLWVSSLAASPMMAFVFTMFGLFFLMLLGWLAPELAEGGWSESLVRWFAMNGHLDSFFRGALSVRDIVYFAVFAMLFLFFAQTSLEAERRK
jgi:ABC-2 type transport system permease protein